MKVVIEMQPYPTDFVERFWAKVAQGEGCWLWTASTSQFGYGQIKTPQKLKRAHRVAWEICRGPIPEGACVLHRCDVPRCVNPEHLFLGSLTDNNRDMTRKGRNAMQRPGVPLSGDRHWSRRHPEKVMRGEKVHAAILNSAQVIDIRDRVAAGEKQIALARYYGVSKNVVNSIIRRKSWKHLPGPDPARSQPFIKREREATGLCQEGHVFVPRHDMRCQECMRWYEANRRARTREAKKEVTV